MSKVTPPGPAGAERLTVKVKVVVPALPSFSETSLIVRLGSAATALGVSEKSSTARPSSAPVASISFQRIKKVAPLGMLRPVIVEEMRRAVGRGVAVLGARRGGVRRDEVERGDV